MARSVAFTVTLLGLMAASGCRTTYENRVGGVFAGDGGATSDLVLFASDDEGGDEARMASGQDAIRRDGMLSGRTGEGYTPRGWWEERDAPRIERPYWITTSRNAETWYVPRRRDESRRHEGYWHRGY